MCVHTYLMKLLPHLRCPVNSRTRSLTAILVLYGYQRAGKLALTCNLTGPKAKSRIPLRRLHKELPAAGCTGPPREFTSAHTRHF